MKNLGLFTILLKLFSVLKPLLIPLLKGAKATKFALAGTSLAVYSYMFTIEFAIILLLSIVFHEYGHIQGMKKNGIKTKGIYLIPFFGGASVPDSAFEKRVVESEVALYGPLYGLYTVILALGIYFITNSPEALGVASLIAFINLFNLFPINPLDGGRLIKSIAFSLHSSIGFVSLFIGILLATILIYYYEIYLLLFIVFFGLIELIFTFIGYRKVKEEVNSLNKIIDNATSQSFSNQDKTVIDEIVLKNKTEIKNIQIDKDIFVLEEMNKSEILRYSFYYISLCLLFLSVIVYASFTPEAGLALDILKDNIGE